MGAEQKNANQAMASAPDEMAKSRLEDQQRWITEGIKRFNASDHVARADLHDRALR